VAAVDPDDDSILRHVVRRYTYDPVRHERRHMVVAAFDNKREYMRMLETLGRELERRRRRSGGDPIDRMEHYTGVVLEPGYRRRQQDERLLQKAIRHGATISDDFLRGLDLPSNVSVMRSKGPKQSKHPLGTVRD
jgi:hypothetical protein